MANVDIKSYNQILGAMVRKIIADTPANDVNVGSVLLTLLEAAAANDFENNIAILNVLELMNIDAVRNNDLDSYASNYGLTRNTAIKASGFIKITDSTIVKRSTSLYSIKPAPIKGTSVLYVNNAVGWNATGTVYIGRGTQNFEGPLSYTSITDNGTFYTLNLSSSLQKDHLLSETVVDGQGTTDRQAVAGTVVRIPSNNISPEIEYVILRDAVIPAGEDTSDNIPVIAIDAGSAGNAGINTITRFAAPPFDGATVTNTNAFISGKDAESDEAFRDRIKAYSNSLSRGTRQSILSAIYGISDETDGKQVESANITEPAYVGDPSIIYIDDGQGFQPSYTGQSVDLLISSASGNEEFLQLSNYPIPRPQSVNNAEAPFLITDGMELKVKVDGIEEAVTFYSSDFRNISSATISEVVTVINSKSELFKCRLTENSTRLLLYPLSHLAETIQVSGDGSSLDANNVLKFSTDEFSYIKLYKNNELLKEIEKPASLVSAPYPTWDISGDGNLVISVDGTPDQDRSFDLTDDFGVASYTAVLLQDWVDAINRKYAGITASATSSGRLIITSNREGSSSTLEITGGSYLSKIFGGQAVYAIGQNSDFTLNRQNGNLQIKTDISQGDTISAGSSDTRGVVVSSAASGGNFNFAIDANGRPSEVVFVVDASRVYPRYMNPPVGSTITISDEGSDIMRVMSSVSSCFENIVAGDYIYINSRGVSSLWIDPACCGLFKVVAKGEHTDEGIDTYVEVININIVPGLGTVQDPIDLQGFYSDVYPQVWRGSTLATPAAASIKDVVASINQNIKNIDARIFRTSYIKVSSTTEEGGSIAIPISVGAAAQVFKTATSQRTGTQSHTASRVSTNDFTSLFKRSLPVSDNVWLDRHVFNEIKGSLTSGVEPSIDGSGTYSEVITDTATVNFETDVDYDNSVSIISGANKGQIRDIRDIIDAANVGTRHTLPRTVLDYRSGDEFSILHNMELSHEDNMVLIMDKDSAAKTIDMTFSRTGSINSGSQSGTFIPTNLSFSANDADNEVGVDFGSLGVWGTLSSQTSTNFNDYTVWFKARNWYLDNSAAMIIRAKDYGPIGDKITFKLEYPGVADAENSINESTTLNGTVVTYTFGSGSAAALNLFAGDQFTVTSLGSYLFRLGFPSSSDISGVNVNDVVSISSTSGFSAANSGTFSVIAKNDINKTIDIYNPSGTATIVGIPTIHTVQCSADVADSLNGTYFILNAPNGDTVKFWYDNNDAGTIEPDIGISTRSWEINVSTGDSAVDVATATAAVILNDTAFATATNLSGTSSLITITNSDNGPSSAGTDGTPSSGFTFNLITTGISDTYETLSIVNKLQAYSINGNDTNTIVSEINNSNMLEAAEQISGIIYKATRDITGVAANTVAYDHDSDPLSGKNSYISLWDSKNWVLTFQNTNPNFQLKRAMALPGVSSVYQMDTTPNADGSSGEKFKLIPNTLENLKHHMTHKALSQLDIVSNLAFAENNSKVQIKSQLLGSSGAIEVIGGRANSALFKILGESEVVTDGINNFLQVKIPSSPNTLSPGQHVLLANDHGVERLNRMISEDTMDVSQFGDGVFDYKFNNKNIYFNEFTKITISDANSVDPVSYPNPGIVWRWTHDDSGSYMYLSDVANGVVAANPSTQNSTGLSSATNIHLTITSLGSISSKLKFNVTCSGQPAQGDYITFQNQAGSTWAAWFSIDGNLTPPTGTSYTTGVANQVMVSILSTDSPNQVISKLVSALTSSVIITQFVISQTPGASLADVREGNILNLFKLSGIPAAGWSMSNFCKSAGSDAVGGFPVIKVNSASKYVDVVNPTGASMASTEIGTNSLLISSTPIIEWRLAHSSSIKIKKIVIVSGVATITTDGPHNFNVGDTFADIDILSIASPDTSVVTDVLNRNEFKYASSNPDITVSFEEGQSGGTLIKTGSSASKYKIQSLNYNNTFRLSCIAGDSPKFLSCGVAVDDVIMLSGNTFGSTNSGNFRVLAVDEDSIVYQNSNGSEVLDSFMPINNYGMDPAWSSNSNLLTGVAGTFSNISIGDWVKKLTDDDTALLQVVGFNAPLAKNATVVTLGGSYSGISSQSPSHKLDQNSGIGAGVFLDKISDIRVIEGDSTRIGDDLFITDNVNANWFNTNNSGTFVIKDVGTSAIDGRLYLRVDNEVGTTEQGVSMSISNTKFSVTEGDNSRFTCIRQIHHVAIDDINPDRRIIYIAGGDRGYKWSQTNATYISPIGKIGYDEDLTTGIDGYQYYTGLLRKVQRIIDGFEPDPSSFPGRKAIGSSIEILPPLPVRVSVALDVTTQDGVNLSEITDEISSTIINYVADLGVGEDVIMSDIIVRVKNIVGVAAVTFIVPSPSNERISISDGEKAFIEPTDISIT
jgi:uncharacterized phage protein gp47/JayE